MKQIVILFFFLSSCVAEKTSTSYVWNSKLSVVDKCLWRDDFPYELVRKLNKRIFSDGSEISLKVFTKGEQGDFVGLLNCTAGFQQESFICYLISGKLIVFWDIKALKTIKKTNEMFFSNNPNLLSSKFSVWEKVENIIELNKFNKENKFNFP